MDGSTTNRLPIKNETAPMLWTSTLYSERNLNIFFRKHPLTVLTIVDILFQLDTTICVPSHRTSSSIKSAPRNAWSIFDQSHPCQPAGTIVVSVFCCRIVQFFVFSPPQSRIVMHGQYQIDRSFGLRSISPSGSASDQTVIQ
jgi:hypothetical protein